MKSRDKMIFVINRLLGCFFEMLYHQLAAAYDLVAWLVSFGRWYRWVEKVIPLISGRDVLEIGIGTGYLQSRLMAGQFRPVGLDESQQMCRISNRRIRKIGTEACKIVRGDMKQLPFSNNTMDSVVLTFPTEVVFFEQTLNEINRVLRTGGRVVILLGVQWVGGSIPSKFYQMLYQITGQSFDCSGHSLDVLNDQFSLFDTHEMIKIHDHDAVLWILVAQKLTGQQRGNEVKFNTWKFRQQ